MHDQHLGLVPYVINVMSMCESETSVLGLYFPPAAPQLLQASRIHHTQPPCLHRSQLSFLPKCQGKALFKDNETSSATFLLTSKQRLQSATLLRPPIPCLHSLVTKSTVKAKHHSQMKHTHLKLYI